jgi:hypothetical protein
MTTSDRRASDRRGHAPSSTISLGAVLADERRERSDRREQPRRRADQSSIAQVARGLDAGQTRLEVIVDGIDGMRLTAMFACGCSASEPIGEGNRTVCTEPCAAHAEPPVMIERRRSR